MIIPSQIADLHVHTAHSHDCKTNLLHIRDVARKHKLMLAITDHNVVSGNLAARKLNINTIPAVEVTTRTLKDFLVYFHHQDSLIEFNTKILSPARNPGKIFGSRTTLSNSRLFEELQKYNCFVSLAHPYCPFPKRSALIPRKIMNQLDGIEVINHCMSPKANQAAAKLQKHFGKAFTAGSDSHHISTVGAVTMRAHSEKPSHFLAEVAQSHAVVVGAKRTTGDLWNKLHHYLEAKKTRHY